MKSIYNIYESILDDIETTMNNGTNDIIIDMIFDKDINKRQQGFEQLQLLIKSYHPKQHKTTAKMKSSDSYFIQFSRSFKIENGEVTGELMPNISYIDICKRVNSHNHRATFINASDNRFNLNISDYIEKWQYIRHNFNPQSKGSILYEVPEELNGLFEQIQIEAEKRR